MNDKNHSQLVKDRKNEEILRAIKHFREMGFEIQKIDKEKVRFHEWVDIWIDLWGHKRYHDLKKGVKGKIKGKSVDNFLCEFFGIKTS